MTFILQNIYGIFLKIIKLISQVNSFWIQPANCVTSWEPQDQLSRRQVSLYGSQQPDGDGSQLRRQYLAWKNVERREKVWPVSSINTGLKHQQHSAFAGSLPAPHAPAAPAPVRLAPAH